MSREVLWCCFTIIIIQKKNNKILVMTKIKKTQNNFFLFSSSPSSRLLLNLAAGPQYRASIDPSSHENDRSTSIRNNTLITIRKDI